MIYGDNTIAQKITSDVISDPNKWSHSFVGRSGRKNQNITIKNGDGETTKLWSEG